MAQFAVRESSLAVRAVSRDSAREYERENVRDSARDVSRDEVREKRQASTNSYSDLCDCIFNADNCLINSTCSSIYQEDLCHLGSGRIYGVCTVDCVDYRTTETYQTAAEIISYIQQFQPALVQFILTKITEITTLSFAYDATSGTLSATLDTAAGVQNSTVTFNQVAFFLSKSLDVFPGTIMFDAPTTQKRAFSAVMTIVDESTIAPLYVSSSPVLFSGLFAIVLALRYLLL